MAAGPVEVTSVAGRVHRVLRDRILAGDLPHGARLHQEALSAELGVSRTPLREAIGRLAADGLVELLPNRGARVADVRPEDMLCAYEARLVIEPASAGMAAARADADALARMRDAIASHRASVDEPHEAFRANRELHVAVVAAAGNPYLLRFAETLWAGRVGLRIYEAVREAPEFIAADADEHEAIVTAIAAGDATEAERLMRDHIDRARDELMAQALALPASG
jgi:DNA-binding GntR family transcriptional regulator